ncbi:hypothetical protein ACOPJQ_07590 [Luteimonas dalianensis]|uniref:hypothetical protein n=1 Tax=Luteimonas dalianensis TaxID=1148196 RepID=UPI003BF14C64
MKWYWRLLLSIGIAMSGGVMAALGLVILDLYLAGHGHVPLGRWYLGPSRLMSISDIVFLAAAVLCGLFAWFVLRGVGKAD